MIENYFQQCEYDNTMETTLIAVCICVIIPFISDDSLSVPNINFRFNPHPRGE